MSDSKKPSPPAPPIPLQSLKCPAQDCNKKHSRAGFCAEHFEWFKEGLINKQGQRPKDFDQKMAAYRNRKAA